MASQPNPHFWKALTKDEIKDVRGTPTRRGALRIMRHPTRIRKLEGFIELPGA